MRKQHAHTARRGRECIDNIADKIAKRESLKLMEAIVNAHGRSPQRVSDDLHPRIYMAAAALLIWFVIAAWLLFGGSGYSSL